jgi:hypothetical protein
VHLFSQESNEMTQEEIRKKLAGIDRRSEKLDGELAKLQATCQHPGLTKKHGSNTGNYDPTADSYWIDFHCPDCRARWREEQ